MSTADIQELALVPSVRHLLKLFSEARPMSEPVPALSYLVEDLLVCCHSYEFGKLCYGMLYSCEALASLNPDPRATLKGRSYIGWWVISLKGFLHV